MCGIGGFNWEDKSLVNKMTKVIRYRGPDDQGTYIDKVSLGNVRLAIIDLSKKGHMPFEYEHKGYRVVMTYNGETYNFKQIRKILEGKGYHFRSDTDTEVILAAYIEYGPDFVTKLNGMWDLCIYDPQKNILFLSRDRMGIKPLYYYHEKEKFIFGSEIKVILECPKVKRKVNWQVANRYMSLRYCFGEETIFKGIKRLLPGHNLIYDLKTNKVNIRRYWDNNPNQPHINSMGKEKEILVSLLKDSIRKRLISDVPLGVFLSSGTDSMAIAALLRDMDKGAEIKTYTIGFEDGDHVNELDGAREIAELYNTNHKEYLMGPDDCKLLPEIVWHLDEPMADPALIPLYILSKNATKEVTVVLTGDGGDEVFGGYDQYRIFRYAKALSSVPLGTTATTMGLNYAPDAVLEKMYKHSKNMGRKNIINRVSTLLNSLKKEEYFKAYQSVLGIKTDDERKKMMTKKAYRELESGDVEKHFHRPKEFLNKFMYFDQQVLLPDSFLMKTDRITMAHSLEARVPLLDYRIVDFCFKISSRRKIMGHQTKYLLKKSLEKHIPKKMLWQPKQTFHVPIENWLVNMKDHVDSLMKEKEIKKTGVLEPKNVQKIMKNFNSGKLYYSRQAWNLLCFQEWYEKFMNK